MRAGLHTTSQAVSHWDEILMLVQLGPGLPRRGRGLWVFTQSPWIILFLSSMNIQPSSGSCDDILETS